MKLYPIAAHVSSTRPRVIGHRGAAALAPANTLAGIEAAITAGVDGIELDVRRRASGSLVLAHGRRRGRDALALEQALDFLAHDAPRDLLLVIDVKEPGTEAAIAEALRDAGVVARTVACAREVKTLWRLREADPSLRLAWSLKRPRHAAAGRLGPAGGDISGAAAAAVARGLANAVTVHRSLATAALVDAVQAAGGQVFVWGVGARADGRWSALGVDAVIVDDPRPFLAALRGEDGGSRLRHPDVREESVSSFPDTEQPCPRRDAHVDPR